MYSPAQSRVVSISGVAIPEFAGQPILLPIKFIGDETLGKLSTFTLELRTLNLPALPVYRARDRIEPDKLVGTELTISIEFDGKGTFVPGMAGEAGQGNLGAGKREVTGLIAELVSTGEDDRYAYYEMKVRPWLWLATLNRENRIFQNKNVVQITEAVLSSSLYPFKYEWRLGAIGLGGAIRHATMCGRCGNRISTSWPGCGANGASTTSWMARRWCCATPQAHITRTRTCMTRSSIGHLLAHVSTKSISTR